LTAAIFFQLAGEHGIIQAASVQLFALLPLPDCGINLATRSAQTLLDFQDCEM
jgi:hypothetical protein